MMIVRYLNQQDSDSCMDLRIQRMREDNHSLYERRTVDFFKLYSIFTIRFYSLGCFENGELVGMCTLLQSSKNPNSYLMTDLVTKKSNQNKLIPYKLFNFINENILMRNTDNCVYAVESEFKAFESLSALLKRYDLRQVQDEKNLYTSIYPAFLGVEKKEVGASRDSESLLLNHVLSEIDSEARVLKNGVIVYTDREYRQYVENGKDVFRMHLTGLFKADDKIFSHALSTAVEISIGRGVHYVVTLTEEKPLVPMKYLYVNRLFVFGNSNNDLDGFDFDFGILI